MTSTSFKSELKRIKNYLINSEIELTVVTDSGLQVFKFTDLKTFGNKVLELEKLGAGFSFSSVSNRLSKKGIHRGKKTNLDYWLRYGVWTKFSITSSLVGLLPTAEPVQVITEPVQAPTFRSKVFKRAYKIMQATGKAFAVCLSKAWALYRLAKKMRLNKKVHFTYEKKDGTLRRAVGTLKNVSEFVKGTGKTSPGVVHYFDVEAKWFRCFRAENLVAVL